MTNSQLVKKYEKIHEQIEKLTQPLIDAGYGNLKPSEMRAMKDKPALIKKLLTLTDKASDLRAEATRRYGPELLFVWQLRNQK